jgi:hypothetical protein
VSGCGPVQSIDTDFGALKGQSVASVESRLGPPKSRQGTTSVWIDSARDDTPVLKERTIYDGGRTTTIQVMERPEFPPLKTCTLTVVADGTGTIVSVVRDGVTAACAPMARKVAG